MSSSTFVTVTVDELRNRDDQHWMSALEALRTPALNEADEPSPFSELMPYEAAYRTYTDHLEDCETCGEGTLWGHCLEGDRLSGIAADAMAAQEDLAVQN